MMVGGYRQGFIWAQASNNGIRFSHELVLI